MRITDRIERIRVAFLSAANRMPDYVYVGGDEYSLLKDACCDWLVVEMKSDKEVIFGMEIIRIDRESHLSVGFDA